MRKLRVAWFSPLNIDKRNVASLSAYLSDELLPEISKECQVEVFYDGFKQYGTLPTYHYLKAFAQHKKNPFDVFFYQFEDKPFCNFIRSHVGIVPGITYFHDFIINSYGPEPLLNSPFEEVVKKFNQSGRPWPDRSNEYQRSGPYAVREARLSPVAIFATQHALNEYRRVINSGFDHCEFQSQRSFFLPYAVQSEKIKFHTDNKFKKVSFCGSPRIENRAHKVFEALSQVGSAFEVNWLIDKSEKKASEELLSQFPELQVNLYFDRQPQNWIRLLENTDIAIHTMFSVFGHVEPYLSMSLMAGVPCISSNFASLEYLPENLVVKVQSGETESFEIAQALDAFARGDILDTKDASRSYAIEMFETRKIAQELISIFNNTQDYFKTFYRRWEALEHEATSELIRESKSFLKIADDTSAMPSLDLKPIFDELGWS